MKNLSKLSIVGFTLAVFLPASAQVLRSEIIINPSKPALYGYNKDFVLNWNNLADQEGFWIDNIGFIEYKFEVKNVIDQPLLQLRMGSSRDKSDIKVSINNKFQSTQRVTNGGSTYKIPLQSLDFKSGLNSVKFEVASDSEYPNGLFIYYVGRGQERVDPPTPIIISYSSATAKDTTLAVNDAWITDVNSLTLKDVRYSTQRGGSVAFAMDFTNNKATPVVMRYNLTDLVNIVDNNDKAYKLMFGSSVKCSTMTETVAPNATVRLRCLATSQGEVFLDIADPKIKSLTVTVPQLSSIENARWLVPMPR